MRIFKDIIIQILSFLCPLLPKQNKIVATSFRGRVYGNDAACIIEAIHDIDPSIKIIWLKNNEYSYKVPSYVKTAPYKKPFLIYQYATAKVWINTHRLETCIKKTSKQLFIETWHGSTPLKKIELWVPEKVNSKFDMDEIEHTAKSADMFISNSKYCSEITYRKMFGYSGKIWRIGTPRCDLLLNADKENIKSKVKSFYSIPENTKILLYAPTFRDNVEHGADIDMSVYEFDYNLISQTLNEKWGGNWKILLRLHPILINKEYMMDSQAVINATDYPSMQELAIACDLLISDYSSSFFDAALLDTPCIFYAKDYYEYKAQRGFALDPKDLPFSFCESNEDLVKAITNFNDDQYVRGWETFKKDIELVENGDASKQVAKFVVDYLKDGTYSKHVLNDLVE